MTRRKRFLRNPNKERALRHDAAERDCPFIPPADRFDRAVRAKAKALGLSIEQFKVLWLRGKVGQKWEQEMRVM